MRVLVTGNMGYVGPAVVAQLRQSYPEAILIGLDTGYFAHCLTGAGLLPELSADLQYFADVRNPPVAALEGVDAVVHLAAISNDSMGSTFEDATTGINFRASVDLACKAKAAGVRSFVFASSCSIYGLADDAPRQESSPLNPLTAYARSKVSAETELQKLADGEFRVSCLRFATACGMSPRLRLDLVLNDFVASAIAARHITILSDGTPWRPLIHVRDMALAVDWAIGRGATGGDFLAVNVGSSSWNSRVKGLAEAVAAEIDGVTFSINGVAAPDPRSYCVDFTLYEQLAPQHQPRFDLPAAIRELRAGLESVGFDDPQFRSSKYMRLEVLRSLRDRRLIDNQLRWTDRATGTMQPGSQG